MLPFFVLIHGVVMEKKVLLICFNAEIKDGGVFVLYVKKEAE